MARAFADLTFTPAVKAAQEHYGSRSLNERLERASRNDRLTSRETTFIEARDAFYQATVSESGWPYVQFRGGPAGFLRVIDDTTIGYADFRGNVQYLSVGNITANDRVVLFLMDYAHQRRLKIWGRARVVDASAEPSLVASLTMDYDAVVERGILIKVEAFDWNCPQHIARRFSVEEIEAIIAPLLSELDDLRGRLDSSAVADPVERNDSPGD